MFSNKESKRRTFPGNEKIAADIRRMIICIVVLSLLVVLLAYLLLSKTFSAIGAVIFFSAYTLVSVLAVIYLIFRGDRLMQKFVNSKTKLTNDMPLGLYASLKQPVAVLDEEGRIAWMNNSFFAKSGVSLLVKENVRMSDVLDISRAEFVGGDGNEDATVMSPRALLEYMTQKKIGLKNARGTSGFGGGDWTVYAYEFKSAEIRYYLIVLTDDTEKNRLIQQYSDNKTHVAYIVIDNLEELEQNEKSIYREASVTADKIIKDWAYSFGAFIKEYEREKYFMLFSHKMLEKMDKEKFRIIELVSEKKYGSYNFGVTVSVGISKSEGSLSEKNAAALGALEMALQRGGNQGVLVKENGELKFFGARTTTTQKRSGVHHRVFADKLIERIKESSTVLIMGHQNPDFDAIGSCAGLAVLARAIGTRVYIVLKNKYDENLRECVEKIESVPGFRDVFIDLTSANDKCDENTLVICSDVNNPRNFEAPDLSKNAKHLFIIDHHRQNEGTPKPTVEYAKKSSASGSDEEGPGKIIRSCETLIVPSASSASELVTEILDYHLGDSHKDSDILHHEIADIMYAGILLDTKNFTRNTQVPTFEAAIYLRSKGADTVKAQNFFKTELEDFKTESTFATHIEIYKTQFAISKGTDIGAQNKRVSAAKSADRLLNIKGISASFVVTELEAGKVFISARSDGTVNVQLIMEGLRGGGHYNAAATMLMNISIDDAIDLLKASIDSYIGTDSEEIKEKSGHSIFARFARPKIRKQETGYREISGKESAERDSEDQAEKLRELAKESKPRRKTQ